MANKQYPTATIETDHGTIELELWDDVAPGHVANFQKLAKSGFYAGTGFHRDGEAELLQLCRDLGCGRDTHFAVVNLFRDSDSHSRSPELIKGAQHRGRKKVVRPIRKSISRTAG